MRLFRFRDFIGEKAVPAEDMLAAKDVGIVTHTWSRNGRPHVVLVLYDFDAGKILGYVEMDKLSVNDDFYFVERVAAEKDYGPDVYDFAMMFVSPESLRPNWMIKPAAQKVWLYYVHNRSDIEKRPIGKEDDRYVTSYGSDLEHERDGKDPEVLQIINTRFSLKPTQPFKELLKRGEDLAVEHGMDVKALANADVLRKTYFHEKYHN